MVAGVKEGGEGITVGGRKARGGVPKEESDETDEAMNLALRLSWDVMAAVTTGAAGT